MIMHGAVQVFAERGVRAASVEDILRAAGVSRRTFYRFYSGKEDVLVALYRTGTDALLSACAIAVSEGRDALARIEGCVDAHLRSARDFGRLIFILNGEAQRHESLLHPRRMEVHDALVGLFVTGTREHYQRPVDPLLFRAMIIAIEGVTRRMLEEGDEGRNVTDASVARSRRVMMHLARAILANRDDVPPPPSEAETA